MRWRKRSQRTFSKCKTNDNCSQVVPLQYNFPKIGQRPTLVYGGGVPRYLYYPPPANILTTVCPPLPFGREFAITTALIYSSTGTHAFRRSALTHPRTSALASKFSTFSCMRSKASMLVLPVMLPSMSFTWVVVLAVRALAIRVSFWPCWSRVVVVCARKGKRDARQRNREGGAKRRKQCR